MADQEVIKNIDFKEIKTRFSYLNLKRDMRQRDSRAEKLREMAQEKLEETSRQEQKESYEYFEYGVDHRAEESMEKTQELIERIQDTSLYVRFLEAKGAMRAHVMNKVTKQLVAVIPWYQREQGEPVPQNSQFMQLNQQIAGAFSSSLTGGEVDRQV